VPRKSETPQRPDSRQLRREISKLKQRSEEILLRLDELARQLEAIQQKARSASNPGPKK
jgi:cell division protein FtsB